MNHNRPGTGPLTVTVLVFPGVRLLDVTGPIEVFASANEFGGRYRMQVASEDGAGVITSAGTRIGADLAVDDVREPYDVLVVPGAPNGRLRSRTTRSWMPCGGCTAWRVVRRRCAPARFCWPRPDSCEGVGP